MKKFCTFIIYLFLLGACAEAQYVTIPDEGFREYLKNRYPACFNASDMMDTTCSEIINEDSLDFGSYNYFSTKTITNLDGLKYFKNLTYLYCGEIGGLGGQVSEIPVLPNSLKYFDSRENFNLKSLPTLPAGLISMNCGNNWGLTSIPAFPSTLTYLNISTCFQLTSIPSLSNTSLTFLDCNSSGLDSLPSLPNTLKYLECSKVNPLKSLPDLPNSLTYLHCSNTLIKSLPTLPASLKNLDCSNNSYLTNLPALPSSLDTLNCSECLITTLPPILGNLKYLDCSNNYNLTSLPSLPNSLIDLKCFQNKLENLPTLGNELVTLICGRNSISILPSIPNSLKKLSFDQNKVSVFPVLPNTLIQLDCGSNPLHNIPVLPSSLLTLTCYDDSLTSLPNFPDSLTSINCAGNMLTTLPSLPPGLTSLECSVNKLFGLPKLPGKLWSLSCRDNQLSALPDLPNSLAYLNCHKNNIYCLPKLPDSSRDNIDITMDAYKITCIPNIPRSLSLTTYDSNYQQISHNTTLPLCTPVNNINHCQSFAVIQGSVFGDINSNGVKDANEFYMPNINVQLSNVANGGNAYTDKNGRYEIGTTDSGHYSLSTISPYSYYTPNPAIANYFFTTNDTLVTTDIALQPNATVDSFKISLHEINFRARPGFEYIFSVTYENIGTTTLTPNIVFNYDNSLFTYDSSSNHNIINNGTNLSLTGSSMLPGEQGSFYIYLKVKTTAVIGTWFTSLASVSANSSLAQDSTFGQISGSFDPNDKQATPIMSTTQVSQGKFINYTIRFQNTGNDTAFTVVVTDTLSALLQENTFELINASHPCNATSPSPPNVERDYG